MYIPGLPNITIPDLSWYDEIGIIFIYIHGFIFEDIKRGKEGFISFGTLSQLESKLCF